MSHVKVIDTCCRLTEPNPTQQRTSCCCVQFNVPPVLQDLATHTIRLSVRVSLFNLKTKAFFGRPWNLKHPIAVREAYSQVRNSQDAPPLAKRYAATRCGP